MVKYGLFLKQPLQLWMFVPCDWDGNVLRKPLERNYDNVNINNSYYKEYQEAKNRCLFEGVEYTPAKLPSHSSIVRICKDLNNINYPRFWGGVTVESLVSYNLPLTESAKKIINT